ncbi:MAG: hypothetical protein KBD05_02005 [Candidatus Pacebacteria bacterium]|nr:hypothetical protein [Candidatus Paceibacterota bacterium]
MSRRRLSKSTLAVLALAIILPGTALALPYAVSTVYERGSDYTEVAKKEDKKKEPAKLDTVAYDKKMRFLAHDVATTTSTTTPPSLWPVKAAYPLPGALFPFKRVVAYYGNFYSKGMGILGEFDKETVLARLKQEKAAWEAADPTTPVVMGIDYIAVTAQGSAQADGTYKLRMPDEHIQRAIDMANEIDGIVILEIQIGLSTFEKEIPLLEKYLSLPNVHLAIDPEFSMKSGDAPGDVIGTVSSADINYAATYLQGLVQAHNLPPKILVIHRFTQNMVTGYRNITPLPEVQMVMVMDGWGFGAKKINTYNTVIYPEPVQFTGFKIFYKNDMKPPSTRLLTPREVLDLTPSPSFIQYQ